MLVLSSTTALRYYNFCTDGSTSRKLWIPLHKKAQAFAEHLANVFQQHPSENEPEEEDALIQLLETPYQLEPLSTVSKGLKFKKSSTA
jgi:hypothetical protein